jgi:regulator of sirC expression with transglutaminase-like and TPR domain
MGWLLGQFGRERLQRAKIITPTRQFFPDHYDNSETAARALFNRTCAFMEVDPASVELVFYQPTHRPGLGRRMVRSRREWAGLFGFGQGKNIVQIDATLLPQPESVIATFAHELAHQMLLGSKRICESDPDHELVTDLTTVFFGMGVFNANDSLENHFRLDRRGEEIGPLGYLTPTTWGYALALCAWLRNEEKPRWAAWLRPAIRRVFRRSAAHLARTGDAQIIDGGKLDVNARVAALGVEYPRFALAEFIASFKTNPQDDESNENIIAEAELDEESAAAGCRTETAELLLAASEFVQAGEWSKAEKCLSTVIRFEPDNGTAYQERVWVLLELGKFDEALDDAEAAVRLEPDDSESYRARGAAYIKAGKFEPAIADLTRYIAEEHRCETWARASRGYYLRGLAHAGLGNYRKAIKDYDRAIRCYSDWPEPYEARALAYEFVGKPSLAQADRDQARRRATP